LKQFLPYNILFVLAIASMGLVLLSNTVFKKSYATTLQYSYPVVEEQIEGPTEPATQSPTKALAIVPLPTEPVTEATEPEKEPETESETEPEPVTEAETEPTEPPVIEEGTALTAVQFPLDINTATLEEILFIPGVGDTMAQRIIQYRDHLGGSYSGLEQLMDIKGVGEQTYAKLWQYFTIEGEVYEISEESDDVLAD
jgi:competence protein ComEA